MIQSTTLAVVIFAILYWYSIKWDPDHQLKKQLNTSYDYIVVGAGSAGSVIASRLSEDPDVTVLLIEAGNSDLANDNIRVPINQGRVHRTSEDWMYYTVPQKHSHFAMNEQKSFWPRGRVLGGSASINSMGYVRGSRHDFNQWATEGCTGWSYKDVLPYFLKIEDIKIPRLYDSQYRQTWEPPYGNSITNNFALVTFAMCGAEGIQNVRVQHPDKKSYWPRGRVLGESGSINALRYFRGSRQDFNKWAAEGCTGWSYKDVLPSFLKIKDIEIPSYHSRGGYLPITETIVSKLPDIYNKAAKEIGLETVDLNGEDQLGYSYMQSNIKNGERYSTARAYLRPVMDRPNLHISVNTMATKIIIKDKKAVGVEMVKNNRKISVYTNKEVIVSGGSVNSPQLLMLSGIGPKEHLLEHGIPVVADLPVGENLEDHFMFFMKYKINQSYAFHLDLADSLLNQMWYSLTGKGWHSFCAIEGHIFGHMEDRGKKEPNYPDYQLLIFNAAQDETFIEHGLEFNIKTEIKDKLKTRASKNEFTLIAVLLHPKSKGTVRLTSKDAYDYPAIDPNYLADQHDVKVLISAIRKSQQFSSTRPLQEIGATLNRFDFEGICDTETFDTDRYWECVIRYFGVTIYHPLSTCRMGGEGDPTAVVDTELRVKGIQGLRVADGSVLRSETSGNTNSPVIMVGEKAADLIRGKDTVLEFRQKIAKLQL